MFRILVILIGILFVRCFKTPDIHSASKLHLDISRGSNDLPSSWDTGKTQFMRLFRKNSGPMCRSERITRICASLLLLALSKSLVLATPLFFQAIIDKKNIIHSISCNNIAIYSQLSIMGLILGLGISRISSGIVQMLSEHIVLPATVCTAEALPSEAFTAVLLSSSRRIDESGIFNFKLSSTNTSRIDISQKDGKAGFARSALDRGLRASNMFLYRTVFLLIPALIESVCVLMMMCNKVGFMVGLISAVSAYGSTLLSLMLLRKRIHIARAALRAEGDANSIAEDAISLAETVAMFGALSLEQQRYQAALRKVSSAMLRVRFTFIMLRLIQSAAIGLGSAAVTYVTLSSLRAPHGVGSAVSEAAVASRLVLVQALFAQLCSPLEQVAQQLRDVLTNAEDLRALEGFVSRRDTHAKVGDADAGQLDDSFQMRGVSVSYSDSDSQKNDFKLNEHAPLLQVKNLTFYYSGALAPTLINVSLVIPHSGYALGVVGPSGSGKSTLMRLLTGLEPLRDKSFTSSNIGSITYRDADVTNLERFGLFSVVGQDTDLFGSLPLMDNILYGRETLPRVGVEEEAAALALAVRDSRLSEVVARLSGGWQAQLGPRGRRLSGGERQRVCLARALYRQQIGGCILLLDEPTSALDAQVEQAVVSSIAERVKLGATSITVSHRLSAVAHCDRILVLQAGRITEQGSHEQLLRLGGWYAEAWALQHGGPTLHEDELLISR